MIGQGVAVGSMSLFWFMKFKFLSIVIEQFQNTEERQLTYIIVTEQVCRMQLSFVGEYLWEYSNCEVTFPFIISHLSDLLLWFCFAVCMSGAYFCFPYYIVNLCVEDLKALSNQLP